MSKCPNINHPDWKALVEKHGQEKAEELYIKNNYEIPETNRHALDAQRVGQSWIMNRATVINNVTNDSTLAKQVIEEYLKLNPSITINLSRLFDEKGKWIDLPIGSKGMHIQNALTSAFGYALSGENTNAPIEYLKEYTQLFNQSGLVQETLSKHSQDDINSQINKYALGEQTEKWFDDYTDGIMTMVRKGFNRPTIGNIVLNNDRNKIEPITPPKPKRPSVSAESIIGNTEEIEEEEESEEEESEEEEEAENIAPPRLELTMGNHAKTPKGNGFNPGPKIKSTSTTEYQIPDAAINSKYGKVLIPAFTDSEGNIDLERFYGHIEAHITLAFNEKLGLRSINSNNETNWNHAEIDSDSIALLKRAITDGQTGVRNDVALVKLAKFLSGQKVDLTSEERAAFTTMLRIHQSMGLWFTNGYLPSAKPDIKGYQTAINNQLFTEENRTVPLQSVTDVIEKEIDAKLQETRNTAVSKARGYIDEKFGDKLDFLKRTGLDVGIAALYDGYLLSKSLTGKDSSMLGDLFYTSIDHGGTLYAKYDNQIKLLARQMEKFPDFQNWGTNDVAGKKIDEYETITIKTDTGAEFKLTKSEAANLYLNLRQPDTRRAIENNGMFMSEVVAGRGQRLDRSIGISNESINDIIETFEKEDTVEKKYIEMIDQVMSVTYNTVNPVFKQLYGNDLDNRENYFPAKYGKATQEVRREKTYLSAFNAQHMRAGGDKAVRIGDNKSITNGYTMTAGMYSSYALQIRNNRMVLNKIRGKYSTNPKLTQRIEMWDGWLNKIEDPSLLFPSQGDKKFDRYLNELMSNFSVFVLGYNPAVVIKQTASYMLAQEYIPAEFLKAAGQGIGPLMIPKLRKFFSALKKVEKSEHLDTVRKRLPLEYRLDLSNESWKEIMKHSDYLVHRASGHSHREISEMLNAKSQGKDMVSLKIPGLKKSLTFSKIRAMEGIRVMDTITIMDLWKATKLWADSDIENGVLNIEKNSNEYWEHISNTAEKAVKRTQPTSDIINRSWLSTHKAVIPRTLTMFTSATQQQAKVIIGHIMDYNNNPTPANRKKLFQSMYRTMFMTALYITAIDALKTQITYGFEDEEELIDFGWQNVVTNMAGYFHVFGTMVRSVMSRIDDQPWTASVQHPVEGMLDDMADMAANMTKGNLTKGMKQFLEIVMQYKGVPGYPTKFAWKMKDRIEGFTTEED